MNVFLSLVHTARQVMGVGSTRSRVTNPAPTLRSKVGNSNIEYRNSKQIRITQIQIFKAVLVIGISDLFRISGFGFGICQLFCSKLGWEAPADGKPDDWH